MKSIKVWYQLMKHQIQHTIRQYKRKKFLLKAKIFLIVILPAMILFIGIKALKIWVRIKIRGIATASASPKIQPVTQEKLPKDLVIPEPVGTPVFAESPADTKYQK